MGAGLISRRFAGQQGREADRFRTKFLADEILPAGSFVAFVEQEVKGLQHALHPAEEFRAEWNFEWKPQLPDFLPGAREPLGNGRLRGQKGFGDFGGAESAKGLEGERGL